MLSRRAAHFANYAGEDEGSGDSGANPHVGGSSARSLGPWSTAVELANAREAQAERRKEKIMEDARGEAGAAPATSWQPKRDPALGPQ